MARTTRAILQLLITSLDADDQMHRTLSSLSRRLQTMGTKLDELQQAVADQKAAIDTMQATIDTKQAQIAAAIAALEAKIAAMPGDAELTAILEGLQANTADVNAAAQDVADTPLPAEG